MKRIIKKASSGILILSILGGLMTGTVLADGSVRLRTEMETLTKLGIVSGYSYENYLNRKNIQTNDFLLSVIKMMMRSSVSGDAVKMAKLLGIVDDEDRLSSATPISYEQAVKIAVRALGYETWVKNSGKSYITVAGEIGFLKGVNGKNGENLTSDRMLSLLFNMISTELFEIVTTSGQVEYKQFGGTILEENLSIKKGEGLVNINEYTSIYSPDDGIDGCIGIDDEVYEISDNSLNDYLGYYVDFYYIEENDEKEIVCVVPDYSENNELLIKSELIEEVKYDFSVITYYKSETSAQYKAKLADNLKVIYNGKALEAYEPDGIKITDGELKLIDNDGDSKYDVIIVTSYELVRAGRVNADDKVLINEYKNILPSGTTNLDFEKLEEGKNLLVYIDGEASSFSLIPEGGTILMSRNISGSDEVVKLYASSKTVSGTITGINYDLREITCGEVVYKLNPSYVNVLHSGDTNVQKLKLGNTYTFSLDMNDKISGAVLEGTSLNKEYVLVYKVIRDDDTESVLLKYVDTENNDRVTRISNKVIIDGGRVSNIYNNVKNIHAEIVEVSYNTEGEIKTINRAVMRTDKTESDVFNCMPVETNLEYRSGAGTTSFGGKYYIDANTDLFVTFNKDSSDEDDFAKVPLSRAYLQDQGKYTFIPYKVDEYGFAEMILLHATEATTSLNILVSGFEEKVDSDGDAVAILTGPVGSLIDVQVPTKTPEVYDGIKIGDFINVSINADGEATGYTVIYSPKDGKKYEYYMPNTFYHSNTRFAGDVEKINYTKKRFKVVMPSLGKEKTFDYQWLVPTVFVYEDGMVDIGSVDDITIGDFVVVRTSNDRPSTIIIYR